MACGKTWKFLKEFEKLKPSWMKLNVNFNLVILVVHTVVFEGSCRESLVCRWSSLRKQGIPFSRSPGQATWKWDKNPRLFACPDYIDNSKSMAWSMMIGLLERNSASRLNKQKRDDESVKVCAWGFSGWWLWSHCDISTPWWSLSRAWRSSLPTVLAFQFSSFFIK